MSQGTKHYRLKLTPREMVFVDDGLRALLRHMATIGMKNPVNEAAIRLIIKKIYEAMND